MNKNHEFLPEHPHEVLIGYLSRKLSAFKVPFPKSKKIIGFILQPLTFHQQESRFQQIQSLEHLAEGEETSASSQSE